MEDMHNTVADHFKEFVSDNPEDDDGTFAAFLYAMAEGNYKLSERLTEDEIQEVVILVGNGWQWETAIKAVIDDRPYVSTAIHPFNSHDAGLVPGYGKFLRLGY